MSVDDAGSRLQSLSPAFKDLLAGGFGGMAGVIAGQPLDTIRVRLQQRGNKYLGMAHAWNSIVSKEGPKSLFKGMAYPLATAALQTAVTFYAYGAAMRLKNPIPERQPSYWDIFLCGVFAGSVQSFVVTPVDVLKIRLQVQTAVPGQKSYVGAFGMARQIIQRAGVQGLFRGLPVTLLRDTPSHGVYFYVYHHIKDIIESKGHAQCSAVGAPAVGMFLAGGVAGLLSLPPVYPLDVVKSRMQVHDALTSPYQNWVHCGWRLHKEEGWRAFFRGGVAGVVSWLSVYPLDVCKSRVQALDRDRSPYKTWVECAAQIYRLEGAAPFWRGLIATLYRAFLVNAAIFTAYESCMSGLNA